MSIRDYESAVSRVGFAGRLPTPARSAALCVGPRSPSDFVLGIHARSGLRMPAHPTPLTGIFRPLAPKTVCSPHPPHRHLPLEFTVAFFVFPLVPLPAWGEAVVLKDVPPMPAGTKLFDAEAKFAFRGRIGGYALKPSRYGVYYDKKVHTDGSPEGIFIRYKKAEDPSFCGTYVIILGDLSPYATMTFWVKGLKGGEAFEIGMNDTISNKREDAVLVGSIHKYLPQGVTTQWQQVKVPLEDFFGADRSRVYSIVFNFNEVGEGTFWIDGISFHTEVLTHPDEERESQGELLLDDFDHSDLNLLGRKTNAYKRLPSVCAFSRVADPKVGQYGRSLRLDFGKRPTGWCGYYTLLNQIDGEYFDLSPYKAVSFFVRGERRGEFFEIGMADKAWLTIGDSVKAGSIEKYLPQGVTTQWQEVTIPLSDFGLLDFSQMGSLVINFHKNQESTLYLDDLKFYLRR